MRKATSYINVRKLGIKPENTGAQNSCAIEAAMQAISVFENYASGQHWLFQAGTYNFNRAIDVIRSMVFKGVSGMGFGATIFKFPAGVHGVIIHSHASAGAGNRGDWTRLEDLVIEASGKTTTAHGVFVKGYGAHIERIECRGWQGDGFHIEAGVRDVPATNANNWRVIGCRTGGNTGHGFSTQGGDSNAGVCIALDTISNGGFGIFDSSFLGNTYVGCHSATNASGGYKAISPNSRNLFLNCHSESDEPASQINVPSMVLNGLIAPGVTGTCMFLTSAGDGSNPLSFAMDGGTIKGSVTIGDKDGDSKAFLGFSNSVDAHPLRFKFGHDYGNYSKFYAFNHANLAGRSGLMIAGSNSQLTNFPMAVDPGRPVFDGGAYFNTSRVHSLAALPTDGTWNVGDAVFNATATAGGRVGWVCVASGTAGTYSEGCTATTDGTNVMTLNSASSVLKVGDMITVNSITRRITAISGTSVTMSDTVAASGPGLAIAYSAPTFQEFGEIEGGIGDSTATPGNATLNTRKGRSAIAAGAAAVTITNSLVTASSIVGAVLQESDATLTQILRVVPASGSFTITGNTVATGDVNVAWWIEE